MTLTPAPARFRQRSDVVDRPGGVECGRRRVPRACAVRVATGADRADSDCRSRDVHMSAGAQSHISYTATKIYYPRFRFPGIVRSGEFSKVYRVSLSRPEGPVRRLLPFAPCNDKIAGDVYDDRVLPDAAERPRRTT